jgi:hypothetical protein
VTSSTGPVYEELYGHTAKHMVVIAFGLVMSALILLLSAPAYTRAIVVAVFGGEAVMFSVVALSRVAAIRVDADGVTVRPYPLRFKVVAFYPWADVVQIRIMRKKGYTGSVLLKLRDGAWASMMSRVTRRRSLKPLMFALPPGVVINQWKLHPARLAAAVASFAPAVQVVEATMDYVINVDYPVLPDYTAHPRLARGWPGWVLAGAAAGLVAGVVLALVNGNADNGVTIAAGFLILLAPAALCVALATVLYRWYRSRRGTAVPPSSPGIG